MAEDRRGFLYIFAVAIGAGLLRFGDSILRAIDDLWYLAADNVAREIADEGDGQEQQPEPDIDGELEDIGDADSTDSNGIDGLEDLPVLEVDKSITLNGYEYSYWEFDADSAITFEGGFTVQSGRAVEMLVMTPIQFESFENGNSYRTETVSTDIEQQSYDATGTIPAGEYVVVLNNPCTLCGATDSNSAFVDVEITASA